MDTAKQTSAIIGREKYVTAISSGAHKLTSDEPALYGGKDAGPDPYQLLAASLGACTAMTLRMYADRKEWDVEEVLVNIKHGKIYSKDCEECDKRNEKIDHLEREIELKGNLTEEQREKLLEIADKCPVHKTLIPCVYITTKLI